MWLVCWKQTLYLFKDKTNCTLFALKQKCLKNVSKINVISSVIGIKGESAEVGTYGKVNLKLIFLTGNIDSWPLSF